MFLIYLKRNLHLQSELKTKNAHFMRLILLNWTIILHLSSHIKIIMISLNKSGKLESSERIILIRSLRKDRPLEKSYRHNHHQKMYPHKKEVGSEKKKEFWKWGVGCEATNSLCYLSINKNMFKLYYILFYTHSRDHSLVLSLRIHQNMFRKLTNMNLNWWYLSR